MREGHPGAPQLPLWVSSSPAPMTSLQLYSDSRGDHCAPKLPHTPQGQFPVPQGCAGAKFHQLGWAGTDGKWHFAKTGLHGQTVWELLR